MKFYSEKQVGVAAFLGGPIPPGILIFKNLKRLGKEKESLIVLAGTFLFTVFLIYLLIKLPDEVANNRALGQLIPSIIGLAVYGIYRFSLSKDFRETLADKSNLASNWSVAGVTVIGIIIYLAAAVGIGLMEPPFPGDKYEFQGNAIYAEGEIEDGDIQKVADQLYAAGWFETDLGNYVYLYNSAQASELILPISQDFWNDEEVLNGLTSLKWLLEAELGKPISVTMEDYDLSGNTLQKRL